MILLRNKNRSKNKGADVSQQIPASALQAQCECIKSQDREEASIKSITSL
jgi:hypothetical protein